MSEADQKTLTTWLDELAANRAAPATADEITAADAALVELGLPAIPPTLVLLLRTIGGFYWDGIVLYGPGPIPPPPGRGPDAALPGIAAANEELSGGLEEGWLLIGSSDEDLFAYDANTDIWLLLDRTDRAELDSFPSVEALLLAVIDERR